MTEDVAALIESNVAEFLLAMGKTGGGTERADEEVTWTVGGSPIAYHNAVVRCDASESRGAELVDLPPIEGLEIATVRSTPDLEDYRSVLAAGFGETPKEADWVASIYSKPGVATDGPWRHIVGRVDEEPVATASLLLTGTTGGIYFVCVRPEFRRRGCGASITHRAMTEAARSGATLGVLGSSPMGQHVYERLGFRTVFSYRLFEFEP